MTTDNIESWSETASSNADIGGAPVAEGTMYVPHINNALRNIMSQVAKWTGADTIASATTTDLSTVQGQYVSVTGTTTITGLGTVKAGWKKTLMFSGVLTLTHNATSLILPGGANITTAVGDVFEFISEGSGNWRCTNLSLASGQALITTPGVPAGGMAPFAMTTPPTGWLECDGSAVSRTTYADLFSAISTVWGAGDGSTTFNLPDIRGEFLRGWDNSKGTDSGRAFASSQSSQNLAHTHSATLPRRGGNNNSANPSSASLSTDDPAAGSNTITVDSSGGSEARPRNIAVMYCIKY